MIFFFFLVLEIFFKIFLTFDDGLSCHYKFVFKILKKYNLNGIFYIPTQPLIKNKLLLPHKIHLILATFGGKKSFQILMKFIDDKMIDKKKVKSLNKQHISIKKILNT